MAVNQNQPTASESIQDLLADLKARADDAEKAGDPLLFGVINELIGHTSKVATRAFARQIREDRAEHNKAFKALKQKFREDAQNQNSRGNQEP